MHQATGLHVGDMLDRGYFDDHGFPQHPADNGRNDSQPRAVSMNDLKALSVDGGPDQERNQEGPGRLQTENWQMNEIHVVPACRRRHGDAVSTAGRFKNFLTPANDPD